MKNSKRILSVLLAFALLATSLMAIPVFAEDAETDTKEIAESVSDSGTAFSDVKSTEKYATAVTVLNKLSIINGYEDGTFKPSNNVTRAEFAALLLRMLGMDKTAAPLVQTFPDVPTTLWAAGTIETAKNLGIITGYDDGTFKPDNNVSYEEALTMIVRAIGYDNYSAPGDVWYSKYVTSANRLGITKNAVGAVGTPATRSCIAQFIYDTLEVQARENDEILEKTVMESYLGLIKAEGIVASNGYTSLETPDVNLKENEIMIADKKTGETEVYRVDNIGDYDNMLGAAVTYYYKEDKSSGYKDIVMSTIKATTKSETVDAASIEADDCDDLTIVYYKSESASSTSKMNLDPDNVVIYNGKLYGNTASASKFDTGMIPLLGTIKGLNTDGDSDYDVLFIDSYDVYAVSVVTASTYTVTDKITTTAGKSIVLDYTNDDQIINFTNTKGEKLSFSSIKKNSTICVKESHDNNGTKLYTVVIIGTGVTGEVTGVSSDKCTVGSKTYKYSPAAAWKVNSDISAPEKGAKYTFFLDINDDIVGYTKDTTAAASANYGFIMSYSKEKEGLNNTPLILYLLTQSGTKSKLALYKNTKINGESIKEDYDYAIELLEGASKYQSLANSDESARQLIKYTTKSVNGETVIDTIVTVTADSCEDTKGGDAEADVLRMYGGFTSEDSAKYTSTTKTFKSGSNTLYLGSAIVFVVPENMTASSDYRKGSASDFKNLKSYNIEAFDISTSKTAKVVVLYGGDSTMEVDYSTAVFRVEEIGSEQNETEGTVMLKVTGYENGATSTVSYWVSPEFEDAIENLAEGDIVRFGTDADGYVTLEDKDILYKVGETEPYYYAWDDSYGENTDKSKESAAPDIKVVLGTVYSVADGSVIVSPEFLEAGDEITYDIADEAETARIDISRFSSAKFYKYDTTGKELNITEISEGKDYLDAIATYDDAGSSAARVFIHAKSGSVKTVIVIE